jgi:hypothetical protein
VLGGPRTVLQNEQMYVPCSWKTCNKHCPRVEMWKEIFSSEKNIYSLDRNELLNFTLRKLNDTLDLVGSSIKISDTRKGSDPVKVFCPDNDEVKKCMTEIEKKPISKEGSNIFELSNGLAVAINPITFRNKILGMLYSYSTMKEFSKNTLDVIEAVSESIGVALENERKFRVLRKNWYNAVEEIWSKIDIWRNPTASGMISIY